MTLGCSYTRTWRWRTSSWILSCSSSSLCFWIYPSLLPIGMIIVTGFHSRYSGIGEKWGHPVSPDCQKPKADSVLHKGTRSCRARAGVSHSGAGRKVFSKWGAALLQQQGAWPRQRSRGCEGALLSCRSGPSMLLKQTFEDSFFSPIKLFVLNIVLKCSWRLLFEQI